MYDQVASNKTNISIFGENDMRISYKPQALLYIDSISVFHLSFVSIHSVQEK
jgi:hypothetical protein